MKIEIAIADPELARAVSQATRAALMTASSLPRADLPVVRLRTERRLAELGARVVGAYAVVRVTATNLRRLPRLVERLRTEGAAGVQLVWDGALPPRAAAEPAVFAVLERARATPAGPPVVLAASAVVADALRILASRRSSHVPGRPRAAEDARASEESRESRKYRKSRKSRKESGSS